MNETRNETSATLEPSRTPKKSKKPFILALAAVFILGLGATVYAMFFNLSPKDAYFKAEINSYKALSESVNETFAISDDLAEKTLEEPSKSTAELGFSVEGLEAIDPSLAMVKGLIEQVALKATTQLDPKAAKGSIELNLGVAGTEFIQAEAYQSDKRTGVNVPLLYDQYLYFNNEDFGKLMTRFDPTYAGPEKLENLVKMQLDSIKNQEKLNEVSKEYGKFIIENIKEENVTEGEAEFEGETYRQLTLKLSEKEVQELSKKVIDKVQADKELKDLLIDSMTQSNFLASSSDIKTTMKEDFEKGLKELENNLDKIKLPDGFKSTILVNDQELIVKRDVDVKVEVEGEVANIDFSTHALREDGVVTDGKWEVNVFPENAKDQDYIKILLELKGEPGNDSIKRDLTGMFAIAEAGSVSRSANVDVHMSGTPEDMKMDFEVTVQDPTIQPIPPIKGHFTQKVKDDLENGTYSTSGEFGIEFDAGMGSPVNVVVDYKNKTEFTEDLKFPNLEEKGENISELSDAELQEIAAEIQSNIQNFMMQFQQMPF
ncbi:hypothetical protein [Alkalihalobacillus sp. AL-G]|uniref:hypothetical protein n=1 Tax=Alkalihalobacillus sp. AL-G TaxID=2926399 RepID=UPI00272CDECE|nr:hypothetical protein [Alkalihalobacillus sp. AL-G]WLD93026.1 hypothetical protein MOJ78_18815 [Alkalihalobacillus sp. AL-G]